jgi:hypothetical protein
MASTGKDNKSIASQFTVSRSNPGGFPETFTHRNWERLIQVICDQKSPSAKEKYKRINSVQL